jgi:hypothetical protein
MLKVTMLLCDHADVANGKLYINGGGWTITGPAPRPAAIALDIKVPWDEREDKHEFVLDLLDTDGQPVLGPTPQQGLQPIRAEVEFQLHGPFDVKPGVPLDAPLAIPLPPIPLAPGSRFEWRLTVNRHTEEDWTLPFSTRPAVIEAEAA